MNVENILKQVIEFQSKFLQLGGIQISTLKELIKQIKDGKTYGLRHVTILSYQFLENYVLEIFNDPK